MIAVQTRANAACWTRQTSKLDTCQRRSERPTRSTSSGSAPRSARPQAIDAVKRFGDAVANEPELKNNPALDGLRKRLLKEPLAFFRDLRDRLQADRDTRPESLARLAQASFDLGNLTDEIGDKQDALIAYRESLAIRQKLADANPAVIEFQSDLADSHNNIGILLRDTGKPAEAMKAYESALAIRQKLADANPTVTEFQSDLADSHNNIGNLLSDTGKPAEAMKAYESALAIRRSWPTPTPPSPSSRATWRPATTTSASC